MDVDRADMTERNASHVMYTHLLTDPVCSRLSLPHLVRQSGTQLVGAFLREQRLRTRLLGRDHLGRNLGCPRVRRVTA